MKNIALYLWGLFALIVLTACDDNDDLRHDQVPGSVTTAFAQKYPDYFVKEWEQQGEQYKAEFYHNGKEAEAWFNADGAWTRTETDYYKALPELVANYVAQHYAQYHVDEVDYVEVPNDAYFEIELEKGDRKEVVLLIRADGTLPNG